MRRTEWRTRAERACAPADPRAFERRAFQGLLRGTSADRIPAVLAALAFGLIAPLGAQIVVTTAAPEPLPQPPPPPPVVVAAAPPAAPPVAATVLTDLALTGPEDRRVVLTFDDGPDPRYTPKILELLRRHDAVATFCMVGSQMQAHPDLVKDVALAGMRICAHSHSHDEQLGTRDPERMTAEVVDVQERAIAAGDIAVRAFRAPGGFWTQPLIDCAAANGMQPLGWSVDPRDWKRPGADAIVETVQKNVHPGAIVLMHDGGGKREQTVAALEVLLPWLAAQGYTTSTL